MVLPAGSFATSMKFKHTWHKGWTIRGQGDDKTEIFSPRGLTSAVLEVFESDRTFIRDLRLTGNVRKSGYSADPAEWYQAALDITLSPGVTIENVVVVDSWRALNVSYSRDTTGRNVRAYRRDPIMTYISWQIVWANSAGGGCTDCALYSANLTAGLEAFQSDGITFDRVSLYNGVASSNSSIGTIWRDVTIRIAANSQFNGDATFSKYNPMFNSVNTINCQQGNCGTLGKGGKYIRPIMIHDGYINTDGPHGRYYLTGIGIDDGTPDVSVEGGYYLVPDVPGSDNIAKGKGENGVLTYNATGVVIDGFTAWSRANNWAPPIRNPRGIVRNSKARLITAAKKENNSADPGPRPVLGPFPSLEPPAMAGTVAAFLPVVVQPPPSPPPAPRP